jgi:CBS domain-containing protein
MRPGVVAAAWHDSADAAFARMRAADLDAIPVVNDERVIGLVEHSVIGAAQRGGNWLGAVPVANLMRRGVFICRADDTLELARSIMDRLEIGLLAVVDKAGRIVGVISRDRLAEPQRLSPAALAA